MTDDDQAVTTCCSSSLSELPACSSSGSVIRLKACADSSSSSHSTWGPYCAEEGCQADEHAEAHCEGADAGLADCSTCADLSRSIRDTKTGGACFNVITKGCRSISSTQDNSQAESARTVVVAGVCEVVLHILDQALLCDCSLGPETQVGNHGQPAIPHLCHSEGSRTHPPELGSWGWLHEQCGNSAMQHSSLMSGATGA